MRQFIVDHRDNEKLHALYVQYAGEILSEAKEFVDAMYQRSQFTSSILGSAVVCEMQKLILKDAAFFEAAALLYAHIPIERVDNGQ